MKIRAWKIESKIIENNSIDCCLFPILYSYFARDYHNRPCLSLIHILIIARQDQPLEDLIVTSYPYVYGNELIDDCIEKLKDYSEAVSYTHLDVYKRQAGYSVYL